MMEKKLSHMVLVLLVGLDLMGYLKTVPKSVPVGLDLARGVGDDRRVVDGW